MSRSCQGSSVSSQIEVFCTIRLKDKSVTVACLGTLL